MQCSLNILEIVLYDFEKHLNYTIKDYFFNKGEERKNGKIGKKM